MQEINWARYEEQARIIKALAHPSRLFIVEELNKQERCVKDLTGMIAADISTVSKHLSILKNAGLVLDEKRGKTIYYHLRMTCLLDFIRCIEGVMQANAIGNMAVVNSCLRR